jgi:protease I
MNVLVISADQFEDRELIEPVKAINEAGHHTDIASLESGTITGKKGVEVNANITVDEVKPDDYELLLLPGGKAPAQLRNSQAVLSIARKFMQQQKPVAAICHGPQILISADLVKGRRMTCYQSVADELKAAGAEYEDQPLVVDDNLISSRQPDDLPVFTSAILERLQQIAAKQTA